MRTDRDSWGVPHLRAAEPLALARLQGRNAAEDRPGQLAAEALRAQGLSGDPSWDAIARDALLVETAQRCFAALDDDTRTWVEAYVAGVNDVVPVPWEPWVPQAVWLSHHLLFTGVVSALWRTAAAEVVGAEVLDLLRTDGPLSSGSNGWLIPGSRTASGAPILAGDPHRVLEDPNVYQQVRLTCDDYDVVGLAVPGVPGIPHFGHTGSVAWGITNAAGDYQDLVDEPSDGPRLAGHALRTPAWELRSCGFETLPRLLRARTVGDVSAGLDSWVEPVNVVLAADTEGGLLHRVAGKVPVRPLTGRVRASVTWDGYHEPPAEPVEDVAVMANARGIASLLGYEFAAAHRATRIRVLLEQRDDWTPADQALVHTDTYLPSAGALLDLLPADADLRTWDRRMDGTSVDAARFAELRHLVVRALAARPELAPLREIPCPTAFFAPWYDAHRRIGLALPGLLRHFPQHEMRDLVAEAWSRVTTTASWGELHRMAPWELAPGPDDWPGASGDHDCVLSSSSVPGVTDRFVRASVVRWVWDLADREASLWVVPFGSREGDHDQLPSWLAGDLLPVVSEETVV